MATITVRRNGPFLVDVTEDVKLIDWDGREYTIPKRPFALCRCGASARKPFCDGTHNKVGFQAAEAAVADSADKPGQ
jgi:CDGSH-type Zn-finger protein